MMAAARAWLTAVVSVTLLLSVVQTLMPKGSLREITSFVGGLLLLAVLLRPLGSVDLSAVSLNLDAYRQTVEQRQAGGIGARGAERAGGTHRSRTGIIYIGQGG